MAPEHTNSAIVRPPPHGADQEDALQMRVNAHTYSAGDDYVVIHHCEPACRECDFVKISSKQALQLSLRDERSKNEKYREKITDLTKKYSRTLRQMEYQKSRIHQLTRQLSSERRKNRKGQLDHEYAVIDPILDMLSDNDDSIEFSQPPRLEIILE